MDISIIGKNTIKIKGKSATFIVDPAREMPKTSADAIALLDGVGNVDLSRITDSRMIISGPGGYEVGGAKISGTSTPKGILYRFSIDAVSVILGKTTESKVDGFDECQVAVINTDDEFSESSITGLEPKITILYGDKKAEAAKALGVENAIPVSKITITKDKLPEKMEVVTLG